MASQAPLSQSEGASAHQGVVFPMSPRSLQGGEIHQEGPNHDPATLPPVCSGPGLCPLAAANDMLDPSLAAPESWLMSLALASSKEVSFQTGQLIHSRGLDVTMRPTDAALAVSFAALREPSPTGRSTLERPRVSTSDALTTCISFEGAGF